MSESLARILDKASGIILDKPLPLRLTLVCLLSGGHLLLEDEPGTGKTTLARAMAVLLGLQFQRIQCTNDMLPGDILGVSVFEKGSDRFVFHPGPIFSQFVLLDEINRATPKTQSGLMQAMSEGQVSLDRQTHPLPSPFFSIATQNPKDYAGTYPLPQSQLDRFLMRINLGLPSPRAEMELLRGRDRAELLAETDPVLGPEEINRMKREMNQVHVAESIYRYILNILQETRNSEDFLGGLSPRAGLALLHCSKAWAFIQARAYVLPEDVQAVMPWVASHRIQPRESLEEESTLKHLQEKLQTIPIP